MFSRSILLIFLEMSCEKLSRKEKGMSVFSTIDKVFWVLFMLEAAMICAFTVVYVFKRFKGKNTDHVVSMLINTLMFFGMTLSGVLVYLAIKGIASIVTKAI